MANTSSPRYGTSSEKYSTCALYTRPTIRSVSPATHYSTSSHTSLQGPEDRYSTNYQPNFYSSRNNVSNLLYSSARRGGLVGNSENNSHELLYPLRLLKDMKIKRKEEKKKMTSASFCILCGGFLPRGGTVCGRCATWYRLSNTNRDGRYSRLL